jgi:hypothetical protein
MDGWIEGGGIEEGREGGIPYLTLKNITVSLKTLLYFLEFFLFYILLCLFDIL